MSYEKYDILTLSDGKDYTISEMTIDEGVEYLLLMEVDKEENILDNTLYVKIASKESKKQLEIVEDSEELKKVCELFIPMLYENSL